MKNILTEGPDAELGPRAQESLNLLKLGGLKGKRILDVGCGYGWLEYWLRTTNVQEVIGIEISEKDIETAKSNVIDERIKFVVGDALSLPFQDQYFDVVVAWEIIEHTPVGTEDKMFSEVWRVLKPGGLFYLSTPLNSLPSKLLDPAWWLIGHRHYSEQQLKAFGEKNGFRLVRVSKKGGFWVLLGSLNMYISKWILRRPPIFGQFLMRRQEREYQLSTGLANIFVTFKRGT